VNLRHALIISSVYEKLIVWVVLALIATAVLSAVYVMLPKAHGADPLHRALDEAQAEDIERVESAATGRDDEDLKAKSHTQVIDTAFGPTVVR